MSFKGLTWWRFGPDHPNMNPGYKEPEYYVCVDESEERLSISAGLSSFTSFKPKYRRTLLIALMMAEGIEPGIIELVKTGQEGEITVEVGK